MFELGIRLAFDKPTIIVKDDKTTYSFDTSPIEHLEYPRDLRFGKIVDFKEKLKEKLQNTYSSSIKDSSYTTFLKHFGEFKVAKLDTKEVSGAEYILDELKILRMSINRLGRGNFPVGDRFLKSSNSSIKFDFEIDTDECISVDSIGQKFSNINGVDSVEIHVNEDKIVLSIFANYLCDIEQLQDIVNSLYKKKTLTKKRSISLSKERKKPRN